MVTFVEILPRKQPAELLQVGHMTEERDLLTSFQDRFLLGAPIKSELAWIVALVKIATHTRHDYQPRIA
jgi:hypothetical protein